MLSLIPYPAYYGPDSATRRDHTLEAAGWWGPTAHSKSKSRAVYQTRRSPPFCCGERTHVKLQYLYHSVTATYPRRQYTLNRPHMDIWKPGRQNLRDSKDTTEPGHRVGSFFLDWRELLGVQGAWKPKASQSSTVFNPFTTWPDLTFFSSPLCRRCRVLLRSSSCCLRVLPWHGGRLEGGDVLRPCGSTQV